MAIERRFYRERMYMKRADKIRNMTDKELAEMLADCVQHALAFYMPYEEYEKLDYRKSIEVDMKLDWLQSEYNERIPF